MNLIVHRLCLMTAVFVIIPATMAQIKINCFDRSTNGKDTRGLTLDCSKMVGKNHPYSVEEWIRYHAFFDDGILANRVLYINLESNDFKNVFVFPTLRSLKKLSFRNNDISTIENQAFSNLPALEELDLSYNSLNSNELRPTMFRTNIRAKVRIASDTLALKVLKLGFNNLHSLPTNFFEYLTKLEVLDLNNNPLLVIDQNTEMSLGYLTNLQVLDLGNTGLSEFPPDAFSQLSKVHMLYLNGNRFLKIPKEIRRMPLKYLNINANPVDRLDDESFVGLDRLQELIISSMMNLTYVGAGAFGPLRNLVTLYISQNPVLSTIHRDAFVNHATNQWPLRQLFISNTNLTNLDYKLYPWDKLDLFDAKSNQWTCNCQLSWLANYINETFAEIPETLLYYRCHYPDNLSGILVSQLNEHVNCDGGALSNDDNDNGNGDNVPVNHSHGHVTRLRHFFIVLGLVVGILVSGSLINGCCREIKKTLKPGVYVQPGFSTGVKYKPADFDESCADAFESPPWSVKNIAATTTAVHGRSPIIINQTAQTE